MALGLYVTKPHSDDCKYREKSLPLHVWRERSIVRRNHPAHPFGKKIAVYLLQCRDSECYAEGAIAVEDVLQYATHAVTKNTGK